MKDFVLNAELREKLARSEAELTRVRGELETAQRQLVIRTRLHDEDKEKLATAQAAVKDAEAKVERLSEPVSEVIREALISELGDTYDCTRVWEAWSVGTMGEDDFRPVLDRVDEISQSICESISNRAARLASVEDNPPTKEAADGK